MSRSATKETVPPIQAAPDQQTLAEAILKISDGIQALQRSGLNKKAILVLLANKTGIGQRTCEDVLDGIADLKRSYCR